MRQKQEGSGSAHTRNMTEGSIFSHILWFAFPLLLGNIFQQLYNMVDTWVVGNYVNTQAFSAVGTVGPIINLMIGTFMGASAGASVVVAQYFGAKKYETVNQTVHTAMTLTAILAVVMSVLGVLITPAILNFIKVPADVFPEAKTYLTIYFAGLSGPIFYNMGAEILRATGDSRRPFYYLVVAAVINTVLDLVFVIVLRMGVAGVAWATLIAQLVSAILTVSAMMRSHSCIRLRLRDLCLRMPLLKKIVKIGLPTAISMAVTCFSNAYVQSYINQFGTIPMSGWTAYSKIDELIFLPIRSLSMAIATFVGQNLGMGKIERVKRCMRIMAAFAVLLIMSLSAIVVLFAPTLVRFFNSNPEVVESGTLFLRMITPFYFLLCIAHVHDAALRGAGNTRRSMMVTLFSHVFFRQVYMFVVSNFICNEIVPLAMGYPAGWLLSGSLMYIFYRRTKLEKYRLVSNDAASE